LIRLEITELIDAVREDKTHGASELARQALQALITAARTSRAADPDSFKTELLEIVQSLKLSRPSMAPVYNAASAIAGELDRSSAIDLITLKQNLVDYARKLIETSVSASEKIALHLAGILGSDEIIMTHSYSSTVETALTLSFSQKKFTVIATRSGAGGSGFRTAAALSRAGIPVRFIDDTAAGLFVGEANRVIVGADRVCRDGGVINGIGTYLLALAAKRAGVPFFVLCEKIKLDNRLKSTQVELEEKETSEVAQPGSLPAAISMRNPYFDITPPDLVTAIVTEDGPLSNREILNLFSASNQNKP